MVLGDSATVNSALAQGLRKGMPRWAKSALRIVPTTPRSERCATSPPAYVRKLKTGKSSSPAALLRVEETTALEDIGPLVLKGLMQPVSVFTISNSKKTGC